MSHTTRYGDNDLAIFKAHIDQHLEKGRAYLAQLEEQITDLKESKDSEGDWMDDSSNTSDLDMLYMMEGRQRKHLLDLENAALRIRNKSYGICIVTNELIDKRRLMAVPTTTKSLEAKTTIDTTVRATKPKPVRKKEGPNQIISKIIKKPTPPVTKPIDAIDDDIDLDDDDLDLDLDDVLIDGMDDDDDETSGDTGDFDFDSIAAEGDDD